MEQNENFAAPLGCCINMYIVKTTPICPIERIYVTGIKAMGDPSRATSANGCPRQRGIVKSGDRVYIVDSGASWHMVGEAGLTPTEVRTVRLLRSVKCVQTANGMIKISK